MLCSDRPQRLLDKGRAYTLPAENGAHSMAGTETISYHDFVGGDTGKPVLFENHALEPSNGNESHQEICFCL